MIVYPVPGVYNLVMNNHHFIKSVLFLVVIMSASFFLYSDPVVSGKALNHLGEPHMSGYVMLRNLVGDITHASRLDNVDGFWEFADVPDGEYDVFIHNDTGTFGIMIWINPGREVLPGRFPMLSVLL